MLNHLGCSVRVISKLEEEQEVHLFRASLTGPTFSRGELTSKIHKTNIKGVEIAL